MRGTLRVKGWYSMCIVCTNTCKHTQSVSSSCLIKHTSSLRSLSIYVCFLNANDGLARALASGFSLFIPMFVSVLSLRSLFSCCHVTVTHGPSLIMRGPNERVLRTEKTSIPLFSILVDWIFPLFPSELWENRSLPLVNSHLLAQRTCSTSVAMPSQRRRWDERYGKRSGTNSRAIVQQRPARG